MKITRFEEIQSWQSARELTRQIYKVSSVGAFSRDFGLRDQIRRASVSVMSNIAEGFERDGNKEFIQFLSTAKGSSGELRSQLYVALDAGFLNQSEFNNLYTQTDSTSKLIGGFMRYLKDSDLRGKKNPGSNR